MVNTLNLIGQNDFPVQFDIFPPNPTAASLGKFADIPIGYYTGTPNIDIPIWEVKEGDIKVPVSLSYFAGGVKVQDIAPWVGIGFALNAGGVITRQVRGLPDELPLGFLDPGVPFPSSYDYTQDNLFADFAKGMKDSQSDLYSFNFAGKTGKFVMDKNGNRYLAPFQKIIINRLFNSGGLFIGFSVKTEDGFLYTFDVQEGGKTSTACDNQATFSDLNSYATSWYLSSIQSPAGPKVTFEYETGYSLDYTYGKFEHNYNIIRAQSGYNTLTKTTNGFTGYRPSTICTVTQHSTQCARLKRIVFTSGSIEFKAWTFRKDLPNDKALDTILIKNDKGNIVRGFNFTYKYMYQDGSTGLIDLSNSISTQDVSYRLALISLQELDANGNKLKPAYQFKYDYALPDRISYQIDNWGFYNGKTTNKRIVPEDYCSDNGKAYNGADRSCDINFATKGTLKQIIYPTGGSTTFTYEGHKADQGIKDYQVKTVNFIPDQQVGTQYIVNRDYTLDFTVNNNPSSSGTIADIDISSFPCLTDPQTNNHLCGLSIEIYTVNTSDNSLGTLIWSTTNYSLTDQFILQALWLTNGTYRIYCGKKTENINFFTFKVTWKEFTGKPEYTVGGLRLSRMQNDDPITGKSVVHTYAYINNTDQSTSGRALTLPQFNYSFTDYVSTPAGAVYWGQYFTRSSTPVLPPEMTQGSFVGYGEVTEYIGETINGSTVDEGFSGRTIYKYTNPGTYPDKDVVTGLPFSPPDSREWMRGHLIEKTDYRRQGPNYFPIKKIENTYAFYDDKNSNINISNCLGLKVGITINFFQPGGSPLFTSKYFNFYTGYCQLTSTKETIYDPNDPTKYSSKTINLTYGVNHLQLTTREKIQSDLKKVIEYVTYPLDYADQSGFIQDLKANNIISAPIAKIVYKTENDGSNVRILNSQIITYKPGGQGLKDAEYYFKNSDPIPLTSFRFPNRSSAGILPPNGTSATLYIDPNSYTKRFTYDAYDSKGNLVQYSKDGFPTSILWGYNNFLPVAGIQNALRGTDMVAASQIAYNGFEQGTTPGEYGWQNVASANIVDKTIDPSNVFAGRYSYKMNPGSASPFAGPVFYLTPPSPQKGKYKLGAWIKTPTGYTTKQAKINLFTFIKGSCCTIAPSNSSNNVVFAIPATSNLWQYFETVIDFNTLRSLSGQSDLSISCGINNGDIHVPVYVDEIRIYPADAQMTTYTYDTQVGVTSVMAPNGTTKFYEYDGLGRMKNVKNQDGNITDSYTYFFGKLY